MTHYLTNVIPNLGNYSKVQDATDEELEHRSPQLNYISVFNPLLVQDGGESDEELYKQIISINSGDPSGDKLDKVELLRVIGVVRGLESFASNFSDDKNTKSMSIRTIKSSIIVQRLEESYYIVSSVGLQQTESKCETLNKQISELIVRAYQMFVLFNTSFCDIMAKYDISILGRLSEEYWGGFIRRYNSNEIVFPPKLSWPNGLNHKGFLGLITKDSERSYKKSSINYYDMASVVDYDIVDTSLLPLGMVLACFDKRNTKKYGMVHMETVPSKSASELQKDSLVDIYNWLEFFDCHNTLQEEYLTSADGMFSVVEQSRIQPSPPDDPDVRSIRSTAANAFEMMNPVTLTNNLVISPFNYTMNSVMNLGNTGEPVSENTEGNSWLKIPSLFSNIYNGDDASNNLTQDQHLEHQGEDDPVDTGEFLIGATVNKITKDIAISRKLIYLTVLCKDRNGQEREVKREHSLVVYCKGQFCIAFIYDSSNTELNSPVYYERLVEQIIHPLIDDLGSHGMTGSYMSNTIDSLRSLNGAIRSDYLGDGDSELDQDFFFLAYDLKERYFKTSLPYLPVVREGDSTLASGINNAMFYLHDQLIDLFVIQQKGNFFHDTCTMNEYFHKFNNTRTSDWMFYYIKHHGKVIIIIKNRNHAARRQAKRKSISSRKPSLVPKQPSLAEGEAPGFLHQISDGVYEYAHLGFLDNLGDDVKIWLENFSFSGES